MPSTLRPVTRITARGLAVAKRLAKSQRRSVNQVLEDAVHVYDAAGSPILDPRKAIQPPTFPGAPDAIAETAGAAPNPDLPKGAAASPGPAPSSSNGSAKR